MGLSGPEVDNLRLTLVSVEQGDVGILHSLGIKVHTVSMVHSRIDRIRGRVSILLCTICWWRHGGKLLICPLGLLGFAGATAL